MPQTVEQFAEPGAQAILHVFAQEGQRPAKLVDALENDQAVFAQPPRIWPALAVL